MERAFRKLIYAMIVFSMTIIYCGIVFGAEPDPAAAALQAAIAAQAAQQQTVPAQQTAPEQQLTPEQIAAIQAIQAQQAAQAAAIQAQQAAAIQAQQAAAQAAKNSNQNAQAAAEPVITNNADISTSLPGSYVLAGSCSTSFSGSSSNRINNLAVASGRFNGMIVQPGQAVSVDATILPRTSENGYRMAGVYSGGKTVPGMGGGICQVSSTVYNAVMNAGLQVTKRSPHSMPVHYLPLGQDAAISSGAKDMVFVNTYDTPVRILTSCDRATKSLNVFVYVQTQSLAGRSYKFYAKSTGRLSADSYRDVYKNGVLVGTEFIGHSAYMAHS